VVSSSCRLRLESRRLVGWCEEARDPVLAGLVVIFGIIKSLYVGS
jgi:hypothetical protein